MLTDIRFDNWLDSWIYENIEFRTVRDDWGIKIKIIVFIYSSLYWEYFQL